MTNVEGRGIVPPKRVWIPMGREEFYSLKERAQQQAIERGYSSRRDSWGRGMVGRNRPSNAADLRDPEYSIFLGLIGEWVTCKFINKRLKYDAVAMDLSARRTGDGGFDMVVNGLRIDVKTQQKPETPGLIRRVSEYGDEIKFAADAYVFVFFDRNRQEGAYILGWIWSKDVARFTPLPAIRGGHLNIEVPNSLYLPVSRLILELRSRKERLYCR